MSFQSLTQNNFQYFKKSIVTSSDHAFLRDCIEMFFGDYNLRVAILFFTEVITSA